MKPIHKSFLVIFLLYQAVVGTLSANQAPASARGIVYLDANRNLILDQGEQGIAGVAVSNQKEVVLTDKNGQYQLPVGNYTVIFVVKPAGYRVPLNDNNQPQFFYIHHPNGSPAGLKYAGIEPTGDLPESINFPLIKTEIKNQFKAIIVGDPQPDSDQEVDYYRDDIIAHMIGKEAEFYLAHGDNVGDDLSLYRRLVPVVGQVGVPAYQVLGNHDMNYQVPGRQFEAETFKNTFSPDYYAFNYGKVHFVVLNDVEYLGWNIEKNRQGNYIGAIGPQQREWLNNDLALVPDDHLVVLSMHIPLTGDQYDVDDRKALFEILKNRKHLLALSAHTHCFEHIQFGATDGWTGTSTFPSITIGAGCGAWYTGPVDERGIPQSTCMDGMPNGYFLFNFNDNTFTLDFYPVHHSPDYQMRISNPQGVVIMDSLQDQQIIVNVFTGHAGMVVSCQLDDRSPVEMQQTLMKDPFVVQYVQRQPELFKSWAKPEDTYHIWTSPLPGNLEVGVHQIKITATDTMGRHFSAVQVFEVK